MTAPVSWLTVKRPYFSAQSASRSKPLSEPVIQPAAALAVRIEPCVARSVMPAPAWALIAMAILGAAIADRQLASFIADPANAGRVCDRGLWSWSRHPNYFFEFIGWCAWPVFAFDPAWPAGWFALAAPAMMYWLLVHVSGIPPLERVMLASRGAAYAAYQARTSAFFPMPPRRMPPPSGPPHQEFRA